MFLKNENHSAGGAALRPGLGLAWVLVWGILVSSVVLAQGRRPAADRKAGTEKKPAQSTGLVSQANHVLDDVEKGVHETGHAVVKGGNKALDEVDRSIHKAIK